MTFKEKWIEDHPGQEFRLSQVGCPSGYGYRHLRDEHDICKSSMTCDDCWDQELAEENDVEFIKVEYSTDGALRTKVFAEPTIKDSGDRTQFDTGAVRDMREGKGRCDLMPLEVAARLRGNHDGKTNMFEYIARFQRTNETHHLVKALFKFAEEAYPGTERKSVCTMLLEAAKHYEEGAKKYGPDNWRRGIPTWCYIDSAVRHYIKWLRGDDDEPHDRAFVWNLMCCIWEVDYHKEDAEV